MLTQEQANEQSRTEYRRLESVMADIVIRMQELSKQGGAANWDMIYHGMKTLEELNRFLRR